MQLVILAAGHGRRFGGLKQLAPVGPRGEAIMDFTAAAAAAAGYDGAVVIVREEIREELAAHVRDHFPTGLPVELVNQSGRPGTAAAVLAAAGSVSGPFAVANADDHYGAEAIAHVAEGLSGAGTARVAATHVLVAYHLRRTVLGDAPVKRGLCELGPGGELSAIVEHEVRRCPDGTFLATPLADAQAGEHRLEGSEPVSMNLWGFHERIFEHLSAALASEPGPPGHELLLPDVLGDLVARGTEQVVVRRTAAACVGMTHREDLEAVRAALARAGEPAARVR